ncbi:tetratricopeptide repeat protein [Formosa algae]|uniref:Tetratricopeptide (TPR) repeat protein n=1 Tax=Formosa algae TaxID=225843 RepID=A0A9X1CB61_9FLAO|nr:tetratricopeptide repeat protein [Formosa algae]MBP1838865.1 tetratricopeptide (TPR) repeat protein [Formosa algae]MDQ0333642.1 tetratricopeptide (TPR) repeat protein [Formosa algae]OEI78832.1 pilus assembly protein PilF [Formosa algae]
MKRFFKIFLIIVGIITVFLLAFISFAYFKTKSFKEKSIERQKRVISFQSNDSNDYFEYSVDINKSGDFTEGFKFLNKAVELDPKLHLGYRGWIRLRKMRDFDKALEDFDRLDSLTPKFVDAPWGEDIDFLRGECYFGKKDYNKGIELFNRNIENQKEDWADIHSFVYLGLCEYELGNYEKAITEFKRALKQTENVPESYFGMAKTYQKLGQIDKAKENILKAENNMDYKRDDKYNEFLNEIYMSEILEFKRKLN